MATALAVPLVVELLRIVAVWAIGLWVRFGRSRTKRLQQQRGAILKDLKVHLPCISAHCGSSHRHHTCMCSTDACGAHGGFAATSDLATICANQPLQQRSVQDASNFERIQRIIEKYDPSERAAIKARAAALASPASSGGGMRRVNSVRPAPSPMRVHAALDCCVVHLPCHRIEILPLIGAQVAATSVQHDTSHMCHAFSLSGHQVAMNLTTSCLHLIFRTVASVVMQGAAVIQFLQSTGHALSPMVDRIASVLDDEPSRKAAIRCEPQMNDAAMGFVRSSALTP